MATFKSETYLKRANMKLTGLARVTPYLTLEKKTSNELLIHCNNVQFTYCYKITITIIKYNIYIKIPQINLQ